ncbi:hypothetical protein ABB37_05987 [Leptomonas pyrrhocoris]|uniref:Uncharacterized protein n=1 Tax=Leptomonas pyrrhocoris TaxID=157538 RepID=A0A0M9FZ33_LEPPY|nr:hypothetical protein ABB37_05987 [Leptomonas pyrrhocoris]KPA78923.1 hypothetical protein ABB37_05987 [Leptomonas pyrrhocoris]|eukprot:XP_015657362.1 hypothetical protein ABB37_05987 [Leptomonas pyrrhocoris]
MPSFFSKKKISNESVRRKHSSGSNPEATMNVQATATSFERGSPCSDDRCKQGEARSNDRHQITPRRTRQRNSLSESSGTDGSTDQPQSPSDKIFHEQPLNSLTPMPLIKGNSSASNSDAIASFTVVKGLEGETQVGRGITATADSTRRRFSSKVVLPRLTSTQSLHSATAPSESSPTFTASSAPSAAIKRSSSDVNHDSKDCAGLSPMRRYPATEPTPPSLQPLHRSSADFRRSSAETGRDGAAPGAQHLPAEVRTLTAHVTLALPLPVTSDIASPDAQKATPAAEFTSSPSATNAGSTCAPSPVFSAMESVPRRAGASSSSRLQRRRKGAADSTSGLADSAAKSNSSSGSSATTTSGTAAAKSGSPSKPSAFDAARKECQASGRGGSSHDRRRAPVAGFANIPDQSSRPPSSGAASGSLSVPLPPPMSADELAPRHCDSPHKHNRHRSGVAGEQDSVSNTPSTRRSRRSSLRMQTPHSTSSVQNMSLSASNDTPRPLTRHASTLSNGQREALKKTPSFLSRVHTPPPSELRESVQLRRVRRSSLSQELPADTPPPGSSHTKTDTSSPGDSSVLLSGLLPPSSSEGHRIAVSAKRNVTDSSATTSSPSPKPERDSAAANVASTSSSFMSVLVRPASRVPRASLTNAPDMKAGALSSTMAGEGGAAPGPASTSSAPSSVLMARPPSVRSSQQRQRQDLLQKLVSPLSISSDPPSAKKTDAPRLVGAAQAVARAGSDQTNRTGNYASASSSDAELYDYYGSFMMTAPQFDHTSPTPPTAAAAAAAEKTATKSPARAGVDAVPHPPTPSIDAKKSAFVSNSLNSEMTSFSDVLAYTPTTPGPVKTAATDTSPKSTAEQQSAALPSKVSPSSSEHKRRVRPAVRQRQVNTYVEEDDDIYQMARDVVESGSDSTDKTKGTSGYDYQLGGGSSMKDAAAVTAAAATARILSATPTENHTAAPAKRLVSQPLPAGVAVAASSAMSELTSSDEDDDEEDEEGLLEGFRPAIFDAARNRRRGSSILFYLDKEDSLSSVDIVVKPGTDGCGGAKVIILPSAEANLPSSQQQPQSDYSMLKASASGTLDGVSTKDMGSATATQQFASSTAEAVARPRVTMEPYVPLGSVGLLSTLPAPPTTNSAGNRVDTRASKSFSLLMDPYGVQPDSSSPSLPASAAAQLRKLSTSRSVSRKSVTVVPVSIFLGTTSRFAPDPQKMHRPLANTFGYTNVQRRARAAAMAAGVSLEAWESEAGIDRMDSDDDDDEEDLCGEVFTDENGDEWYWEEVEEGDDPHRGDEYV